MSFSEKKISGKPVHVMEIRDVDGYKEFYNKYDVIDSILLHPEVKDRKIVIMSIIGEYRKGKSFFLDYCLRYMYANYASISKMSKPVPSNWMGDGNEPLSGFSWKHGYIADTKGILFWPDVFLHNTSDGDKIAIIIMDTQGLFELGSTQEENAMIFGLSTLISSIQIINVKCIIQESQIEYLEMATSLTKVIAQRQVNSKSEWKVFQKLLFLIRDWSYKEVGFGYSGGATYLKEFLNTENRQDTKAQAIRKTICDSFDSLDCFLLNSPGSVVTSSDFHGEWSRLEEDFVVNLKVLIESILSPENLKVKSFLGKEVNASEFRDLLFTYFNVFRDTKMPEIENILQMTVDSQMKAIVGEQLKVYQTAMNKDIDMDQEDFESWIQIKHESCKKEAISRFFAAEKLSDDTTNEKYEKILKSDIEASFKSWTNLVLSKYQAFETAKKGIMELDTENANYVEKVNQLNSDYQNQVHEGSKIQQEHEERAKKEAEQEELLRKQLTALKQATKDREEEIRRMRKEEDELARKYEEEMRKREQEHKKRLLQLGAEQSNDSHPNVQQTDYSNSHSLSALKIHVVEIPTKESEQDLFSKDRKNQDEHLKITSDKSPTQTDVGSISKFKKDDKENESLLNFRSKSTTSDSKRNNVDQTQELQVRNQQSLNLVDNKVHSPTKLYDKSELLKLYPVSDVIPETVESLRKLQTGGKVENPKLNEDIKPSPNAQHSLADYSNNSREIFESNNVDENPITNNSPTMKEDLNANQNFVDIGVSNDKLVAKFNEKEQRLKELKEKTKRDEDEHLRMMAFEKQKLEQILARSKENTESVRNVYERSSSQSQAINENSVTMNNFSRLPCSSRSSIHKDRERKERELKEKEEEIKLKERELNNIEIALNLMDGLERSMKKVDKTIKDNRHSLKDLENAFSKIDGERNELKALKVSDFEMKERQQNILKKSQFFLEDVLKKIHDARIKYTDIQPDNIMEIQDFGSKRKFYNHLDVVDRILLQPEVKIRKIVVISFFSNHQEIAEHFLGYCLNVMYEKYSSVFKVKGNWNSDKLENRFSWTRSNSNGISFWPDVFLHDTPKEENIAIILMNTQGLFVESTSENSARIFDLCNLVSSMKIIIDHFVTEENNYSKEKKNYWSLGLFSSNNNAKDIFENSSGKTYRVTIENARNFSCGRSTKPSCDSLKCILQNSSGTYNDEDKKFNETWSLPLAGSNLNVTLESLVRSILKDENLKKNSIRDRELSCTEYRNLIHSYLKEFEETKWPTRDRISELSVENFLEAIVDEKINIYLLEMRNNSFSNIHDKHSMLKKRAIEVFLKEIESESIGNFIKYELIIEKKIEETFLREYSHYLEGEQELRNLNKETKIIDKPKAEKFRWTRGSFYYSAPTHAVKAGHNQNKYVTYVGRVLHKGRYLPVDVCLDKKDAHFFWGGKYIETYDFDFLICPSYEWIKDSGYAKKSHNAISYGTTLNPGLTIGRASNGKCLILGEYDPVLKEFTLQSLPRSCDYEILTMT